MSSVNELWHVLCPDSSGLQGLCEMNPTNGTEGSPGTTVSHLVFFLTHGSSSRSQSSKEKEETAARARMKDNGSGSDQLPAA